MRPVALIARAALMTLAVTVGPAGQARQTGSPASTIYDKPISESLRLRVTVSEGPPVVTRVTLADRRDASRSWEIAATVSAPVETVSAVERADATSIVLVRTDSSLGFVRGDTKLFFDTASKRLVTRIDFDPSRPIDFEDDATASRALGVPPAAIATLRARRVLHGGPAEVVEPPLAFETYPLPQSSYRAFARARPGRVRDGYGPTDTTIEERVGPYQQEGERLWFGKTFSDGEGYSGVGDVGYLEAGKYTLLRVRELADWSVSSLLVEEDAIWAGRFSSVEGPDQPGGLIRIDRATRRVRRYDVPDVIHAIARTGGVTFLGTSRGLYRIDGLGWTRFHAEPAIDGRLVVLRERLR
jgi:hypothetical protein